MWCGTEGGHPSVAPGPGPWGGDVWSTNLDAVQQRRRNVSKMSYWGDPNGTVWAPMVCDPQLFASHLWFWEPGQPVRSLSQMIPIYHDIVGRGMVMSPPRDSDPQELLLGPKIF
jgi:hypothetical protein